MVAQMSQTDGHAASTNGQAAIDVHHVSKTYKGKVRALRDVSLRVEPGEIFGLLGPNGAGKSTLIKILMTIVRASRCQGSLLGEPIGSNAALARVGYLPEHLRFPDYLTGAQALDVLAALANVPRRDRKSRATELLQMVGMTDWRNKRIKTYSKGMKQRLGVAQALMNDPDLILLDEPTDGVDPTGRRDIREITKEIKHQGKTVFINSHLLSELEMVCDRVAILVKGEVVQQGLVSELSAIDARYEIDLGWRPEESPALARALGVANARVDERKGERCCIVAPGDNAETIQPIIDALRAQSVTITSVKPVKSSLEDLFMQAVDKPGAGGVGAHTSANRAATGGDA